MYRFTRICELYFEATGKMSDNVVADQLDRTYGLRMSHGGCKTLKEMGLQSVHQGCGT